MIAIIDTVNIQRVHISKYDKNYGTVQNAMHNGGSKGNWLSA